MNQDTIVQFLLRHGPVRDDSPVRANAIKKAWALAQALARSGDHPEYKCTDAAWGFHVKNLEDHGRLLIERSSPRISTSIDLRPTFKSTILASRRSNGEIVEEETASNVELEDSQKPAEVQPAEVVELPPALEPVPVDTSNEPLVRVSVELPASRAAQILAELSELPPPAALEPSQIAVLVDGYRGMTEQLQNFVSEVFAAWLEMTEKIDRIEEILGGSLTPITTVPVAVDEEPSEKPEKPIKPRLSAVPNSVGDKDLRTLYGTVAAQGYDLERSSGGHIKMIPQNGANGRETLIGPSTPSDHRSIKNLRAQLRRAGVTVP